VREKNALEDNYKAIQAENYSLREYIIHLQSRLIDNQQEFPDPPPNVNLSNPTQTRPEHMEQQQQQHLPVRHENGPVAPMAPMNQLQAAASRTLIAAGVNPNPNERTYEQHKRFKEDNEGAAADELIRSQLGAGPHGNNHGLATMSN